MKTVDWPRARVLFDEICDLDAAEQQRRIDALALSGPDRKLLETMLVADRQQRLGDEAEAHTPRRASIELNDDRIGSTVGAWHIDTLIGAGGMGRVYRAHREDGLFEGLAAIKFVAEAANPEFFATERHVLARLAHAGIARLLDAGEDARGRPFLVMEYIAGREIDDYCANAHANAERRIELIAGAARAIAYAHGQMVLHRDIKPGNLLVDSSGQVKVLDFGVAKLLDRSGQDQRQTAARYFTLRYAAPEQIAGEPAGVAADVYALAVVLFELLTSEHPFTSDFAAGRSLAERVLAGDATPLRRVLKHYPDGPLRGFSAERVRDLEAVLGKALARDPAARYASAHEFGEELQRVLDDRPVLVRIPSAAAQLLRLASQHRLGVALGAAALSAVFALSGVAVWQAREARQQAQVAEQRAGELEQVSKFQAEMLAQVDTSAAGQSLGADILAMYADALTKSDLSATDRDAQLAQFTRQWQRVNSTDAARNLIDRTILKPAVAAIDAQFQQQPRIDANLRQTLAVLYSSIGLADTALPLEMQALATLRRELGSEHPNTLEAITNVGVLLRHLGKIDEAEPFYLEALTTSRRALGMQHDRTLISISNLGVLRKSQGRLDEAETLYREAVSMSSAIRGPENPDTLTLHTNLGILLQARGKLDEAEPFLRETLAIRRRLLGGEDPATLKSIFNYAIFLRAQGKLDESEGYLREALGIERRVFGDQHPQTLLSINNLGASQLQQGKLTQAEPYLLEAVQGRRRVLGDAHPDTLISIGTLAKLLQAQGKSDQAVALLTPAIDTMRRVFTGDNAHYLARWLISLGGAHAALLHFPAAEANLLEAQSILAKTPGPNPADSRLCLQELVGLYSAWEASEPQHGHAASAAKWQRSLGALDALSAQAPAH